MAKGIENGIRLYKTKAYDRALAEFLAASDEPEGDVELSYYLGLCYAKLENYDEALVFLEQVVENHTNLLYIYQARMILSFIYNLTGRYRLTEFELKKLLESGFESAQVYAAFAFTAYSLGRVDDSLELLDKALALEPDNPNALNSLGYTLAEEDIDVRKALEVCKRAVNIAPDKAAYLDSLGWAYFKSGEIDEARRLLGKAFKLSGGDSTIADHLRAVIDDDEKKTSQ